MKLSDLYIRTKEDLIEAVKSFGFLPLFSNSIIGFSVEEHVSPKAWFSEEPGVWEWKGPVIRETGCAYGKFFEKKAVFVSPEWFPDFANYRRDGYDFDARYEDELASFRDKTLYDLLAERAPVLSRELKAAGNYGKDGNKGFDTLMTRLQEECYALISDFVYLKDKNGKTYGWGVAEYSTPEKWMGRSFTDAVYRSEPSVSYEKILDHFRKILPGVGEDAVRRFLR